MVMRIAYELHVLESVVLEFTGSQFARWVAFFKMQDAAEAKRNKTSIRRPPRRKKR